MRAVSCHQPHASRIAAGEQITERRSRRIALGPLVVCATKRPVIAGLPCGVALGIVDVVGVEVRRGGVVWHLENARAIEHVPVIGGRSVFPFDGAIRYAGKPGTSRSVEPRRPLRAPGPYTLALGAREIRGEAFRGDKAAHKRAATLATELGRAVTVCREGWPAKTYQPGEGVAWYLA